MGPASVVAATASATGKKLVVSTLGGFDGHAEREVERQARLDGAKIRAIGVSAPPCFSQSSGCKFHFENALNIGALEAFAYWDGNANPPQPVLL